MTSPRASPTLTGSNDSPPAPLVPDEDHGVDLPMSMTASVILTNLPKDATQALADVETLDDRKGRLIVYIILTSLPVQPLHFIALFSVHIKMSSTIFSNSSSRSLSIVQRADHTVI